MTTIFPRYVESFVTHVCVSFGLGVAGIVPLTSKGKIAHIVRVPPTKGRAGFDWDAFEADQQVSAAGFEIVRVDFPDTIAEHSAFPGTGHKTTLFVVELAEGATIPDDIVDGIRDAYLKTLAGIGNEISAQVGAAYLSSSSDTLGIRTLLAASLKLMGLDHIAVIRYDAAGRIDVIAQYGPGRDLEEEHLARLSLNKRIVELARDLGGGGIRQFRSLAEDPLIGATGGGVHGGASSIYINTSFYPSDAVKKQSLSGIWMRGSSSHHQLSWEDIFLLHSLGHAVSIVVSVGSILTTRLIQLQRMTHSNGSILASMTSSVNQTSSELESLLLACRGSSNLPVAGTITSLGLRARDHLSYIRLNVHQMQAKITLSLWLEHEAGIQRALNLERFNLLESLYDIMSYAPALVESWAADYSGAARPAVHLPSRQSSSDFNVRSRKDIFEFALLNLLENAVKYRSSDTPAFTCIAEHARDPKTYARTIKIYVQDDGGGIAHDDVDHIFRSGWRPTRHKRSDIPGHGLGLYQTRELLNLIGADVHLASRAGPTSFCITIPVDPRGR